MLSQVLLLFLMAVPGQTTPEVGQVLFAIGALRLQRGELTYLAKPGATVCDGDRLIASSEGIARFFLDDGHLLALGAGASALVRGRAGARHLTLERGEARITAGGSGPLIIDLGSSRAEVTHGIVRARVEGARVRVERGVVQLQSAGRSPIRIQEGREVSMATGGRPALVSSSSASAWTIQASEMQLGSAAADVRQLLAMQVTGAKGDAPKVVQPGLTPPAPGQTTPSAPTPTNPIPNPEIGPPAPVDLDRRRKPPVIPPPPEETDSTRSAPIPVAPLEEANRGAGAQPTDTDDVTNAANRPYQPIAVSQPASLSSVSLALGNISASSSAASSGALFSDAQQDSINLSFPGNIHLVTAQTSYVLRDVQLRASDMFPTSSQYWSIGVGALPKSQVATNVGSGTNATPSVLRIPGTRDYLLRFDQVRFKDPNPNTSNSLSFTAIGVTGFVGVNPISPQVIGAQPLTDPRAVFNNRATFALGEFGLGTQDGHPVLNIRRSDQDRQIIKSNNFNDDSDKITPNSQVNFTQVHDAKFFPNVPLVYVPVTGTATQPTLKDAPTYAGLDLIRKAAATTLFADSLWNYSKRTGQTRFVVGGQVVDITGYKRATTALMRSGHAAPGMAGGPVKAAHHAATVARGASK